VVAGVTTAAVAAEPDADQPAAKTSILDPLGLFSSSKPAPQPARSAADIARAAQPPGGDPKEAAARLDVCLQLREIAQQSGNKELERTVDQLEARAFETWQQRTATVQPTALEQPKAPEAVQKLTEKPPASHRDKAPWARAPTAHASTNDEDKP
jgi:hypothetical protein